MAKYQIWKEKYNKTYDSDLNDYRFNIYKNNYKRILEHNNKKSSYNLGENQFMDLTFEEFKQ